MTGHIALFPGKLRTRHPLRLSGIHVTFSCPARALTGPSYRPRWTSASGRYPAGGQAGTASAGRSRHRASIIGTTSHK